MVTVALRVVRSILPRALYLEMARLTTRGLTRGRLAGKAQAVVCPRSWVAEAEVDPRVGGRH
jgi:hypothetical protein